MLGLSWHANLLVRTRCVHVLFFVFIALQLGQLYTVTSEHLCMRAALFDSALKGIPIQSLRHKAPRGGHFLGMCFMERTIMSFGNTKMSLVPRRNVLCIWLTPNVLWWEHWRRKWWWGSYRTQVLWLSPTTCCWLETAHFTRVSGTKKSVRDK